MYRKFILTTITILILLAGCIPVGQLEVGVEASETPAEILPEPEPTPTPEIVEPAPESTEAAAGSGEVSGAVCFPSEYIPPMTLWFRDNSDGTLYSYPNGENASTYSHELPVGTYIAYGYPNDGATFGGMYSVAVPCGLNIDCLDHTPLPFDVVAGGLTTGIDICDWYAETNQVPQNPNASFQTNPALAGLVYRDFNIGGTWLVGEGGQVRPLLDEWTAVISPDGSLALFERDDDIYMADLANGTWRNLTNTPDRWESNPQFVPGGSLVFFFSGDISSERMSGLLTIVSQDGTGYAVADERPTSVPPAFHPDGELMAFSLGDTAWVYHLVNGAVEQFDPAVYGLEDVRSIASPSWSPDGSRLAWWVVTGDPGASQTALALFDLGAGLGSGSYTLLHPYQPIGGGGYNPAPVWSPDSRWMAATVLSEGSKAALWIFSVDGDEIDLGDVANPVWSSDGTALIVTQWPPDGGPAWESTAVLYLTGEWIPNTLDLNPGSIPIAFLDR
ncbi:MAG TPA: hypothetical protein VMN57_11935 [Anaerolineales bacterium]|nr:hypothetical protein [Anaerolineales bacterium]